MIRSLGVAACAAALWAASPAYAGPAHGTLAGGVYAPAPGFTGQDAVVYR
jgi:hypothetical protein